MTNFYVFLASDMKHYMVGVEHPDWNITDTGSYGVFEARVLGLSYAQSLEYIRDNFNGILKGKQGYTHVYFKNKSDADKLSSFLNNRLSLILNK